MGCLHHGHVGVYPQAAHATGLIVNPQYVLLKGRIAEIALEFDRPAAVFRLRFEQHFGLRFAKILEIRVRVGGRIGRLLVGKEVFQNVYPDYLAGAGLLKQGEQIIIQLSEGDGSLQCRFTPNEFLLLLSLLVDQLPQPVPLQVKQGPEYLPRWFVIHQQQPVAVEQFVEPVIGNGQLGITHLGALKYFSGDLLAGVPDSPAFFGNFTGVEVSFLLIFNG